MIILYLYYTINRAVMLSVQGQNPRKRNLWVLLLDELWIYDYCQSCRKWRCCLWKYVWRYSVSWITTILLLLNKVSLTHSHFLHFYVLFSFQKFFFSQSNWRCNSFLSFKSVLDLNWLSSTRPILHIDCLE